MTNLLSQQEVYELARTVSFNHRNARIASAVAMCEAPATLDKKPYSDFDRVGDIALADKIWGYSYGGFQIRSLRSQSNTGGIRDATRLLEPEFNARSARSIRLAQGWKAWTVFKTGAYKAYLQDLYPPPPNTHVVVAGDTLSGIGAAEGIDWHDLAKWNGIVYPYTIYIGQIILLVDPTGA